LAGRTATIPTTLKNVDAKQGETLTNRQRASKQMPLLPRRHGQNKG